MFFNNSFYIFSHGAAIYFLIWTSCLSSNFLTSQLNFSLLANLFLSFWLLLGFFWMLWMLFTVLNLCHVPHVPRLTTWGTLFTERHFSVYKKWQRSWSYASLTIYNKTFAKNLKAVCPKSSREPEKKKRKRKAIAKRYALKHKRNKIPSDTYWRVQLVCKKVQARSFLEPPMEYNQGQMLLTNQGSLWSF